MAESGVRRRWTLADLEAFPDDGGWTRYEIIDGELAEMHAPSDEHQDTCTCCAAVLWIWNEQARRGRVWTAPGLIFDGENNVIPDIVWVSHGRRSQLEGADGKLHGGPELVVEVLSPGAENEQRDRETKRALYGRRGVDEYWVLDPAARTVSVYRRVGPALVLAEELGAADTLTSPLLEGFSVVVARLFPE